MLEKLAQTLCICLLLGAIGCIRSESPVASQPASAPQFDQLVELTESQSKQKVSAIAAKEKLFGALLNELMTAMSQNGPAKSIMVCKNRAPEIAADISRETGVRIGRTSLKLRNSANQPPAWASQFVENQITEEVFVELPKQELGALLPIRLQSTCILCHGNDQQVSRDVKAAIVANYPEDKATGFVEGDLRGYFWVEIPAVAQSSE